MSDRNAARTRVLLAARDQAIENSSQHYYQDLRGMFPDALDTLIAISNEVEFETEVGMDVHDRLSEIIELVRPIVREVEAEIDQRRDDPGGDRTTRLTRAVADAARSTSDNR